MHGTIVNDMFCCSLFRYQGVISRVHHGSDPENVSVKKCESNIS